MTKNFRIANRDITLDYNSTAGGLITVFVNGVKSFIGQGYYDAAEIKNKKNLTTAIVLRMKNKFEGKYFIVFDEARYIRKNSDIIAQIHGYNDKHRKQICKELAAY